MNKRADYGFTLLEVVIALLIAGLALGFMLPALSHALNRSGRDGEREQASILAGSILDQVGSAIPLRDGTIRRADPPFQWEVRIAPWCPDGLDHCDNDGNQPIAHRVTVSIGSMHGTAEALISLETIRLGPPE